MCSIFLSTEERCVSGRGQVRPVWFPHWYCASWWNQAGQEGKDPRCPHAPDACLAMYLHCTLVIVLSVCFHFGVRKMTLYQLNSRFTVVVLLRLFACRMRACSVPLSTRSRFSITSSWRSSRTSSRQPPFSSSSPSKCKVNLPVLSIVVELNSYQNVTVWD